ncbi:MAG: tetratricopeptide repeat protein [Bacteroidota bacterium]
MRYLIFAAWLLISTNCIYAQEQGSDLSANDIIGNAENPELALADSYYENGEWELAVDSYERAKRGGGFTSVDLNRYAIALIELDRYESAQRLLENLTRIFPDDKTAWFNLGIVQYHFDRYPSALNCFQTAAGIVPDWAQAWYSIAFCELLMDRPSEAWKTLDIVIALDEELGQRLLEILVADEAYRNDPAEEE